jgi:uncharacterized coiled-coil DUF342 family protein
MVDQIENLNHQANEINVELNLLKNEFDKYYRQKIKTNEKFITNVKKLKISKKNRDNLNFKVKFLNWLRSKSQKTFIDKLNQLKELRKKNINLNFNSKREKKIQNQIDKIEWKIQTEITSIDEEKKLVNQVKKLETELNSLEIRKKNLEKINYLQVELNQINDYVEIFHGNILNIAEKSQFYHEKIVKLNETLKSLKDSRKKFSLKCKEYSEKIKILKSKYNEIIENIHEIKNIDNLKKEKEKVKKNEHFKEKFEEKALSKLKKGKKLTFEEFKVLSEKKKI